METTATPEDRPRLLLIDDDRDLTQLMSEFFREHGLRVKTARDGRLGLTLALRGGFDLVLLDVMLPVIDGFSLLEQIRRRSQMPVIMLTARTAPRDRIAGLDGGADDYLPKPFAPEELLARVRAVLRRTRSAARSMPPAVEAGGLIIDSSRRSVLKGDDLIVITSIEFDILEFLARHAGRIVSRDELTTVLHQRPATPYERSIDVHISHLRRKLGDGGSELIRSIRGVGYIFAAPANQ